MILIYNKMITKSKNKKIYLIYIISFLLILFFKYILSFNLIFLINFWNFFKDFLPLENFTITSSFFIFKWYWYLLSQNLYYEKFYFFKNYLPKLFTELFFIQPFLEIKEFNNLLNSEIMEAIRISKIVSKAAKIQLYIDKPSVQDLLFSLIDISSSNSKAYITNFLEKEIEIFCIDELNTYYGLFQALYHAYFSQLNYIASSISDIYKPNNHFHVIVLCNNVSNYLYYLYYFEIYLLFLLEVLELPITESSIELFINKKSLKPIIDEVLFEFKMISFVDIESLLIDRENFLKNNKLKLEKNNFLQFLSSLPNIKIKFIIQSLLCIEEIEKIRNFWNIFLYKNDLKNLDLIFRRECNYNLYFQSFLKIRNY